MNQLGQPRPALGVLYIVLANLLGGASFPMQRAALDGLGPGMIAALRHLIALPFLWWWMRSRGRGPRDVTPSDRRRIGALGIVAFGLPLLLGNVGVGLASASNGAILVLIEPVMILVFARCLLGERIGTARALGVVLGLAGALCIVLESAATSGFLRGERFLGNVVLVIHAALWGLYTPLVRPLLARNHVDTVSALTVASSLLLLLPYGLWDVRDWRPDEHLPAALGWTVALALGVSLTTTLLWVGAVRHLEASRIAPFVFLQPLSGVLLGHLFLGERLSSQAVVGAALIAIGCLCGMRPAPRGTLDAPQLA